MSKETSAHRLPRQTLKNIFTLWGMVIGFQYEDEAPFLVRYNRPLWRKNRRDSEIDANSCNEETCASAHACSVKIITKVDLLHLFGTYCNAHHSRHKWKLFGTAYCSRGFLPWWWRMHSECGERKTFSMLLIIWIVVVRATEFYLYSCSWQRYVVLESWSGTAKLARSELSLRKIVPRLTWHLVFSRRRGFTGGQQNVVVMSRRWQRMSMKHPLVLFSRR